jgi:hypothetical protein
MPDDALMIDMAAISLFTNLSSLVGKKSMIGTSRIREIFNRRPEPICLMPFSYFGFAGK